jgi:uncharacterized protein (TIGR03083 family)
VPSADRELIRSEAEHILEVGRQGLERPVPQYPGWTMFDLLSHLASVHGRTMLTITELLQERIHGPLLPDHGDVLRWFQVTLDSMLEAFASADPNAPVWGFTSHPTVGGWEIRMVIETGLHRWDADQAGGELRPLHDRVASLGLEEYADLYLSRLGPVPPIELTATDLERSWVVGAGEPELRAEGTASDLYLRLMSRPGAELPPVWARAVDALEPPPKR